MDRTPFTEAAGSIPARSTIVFIGFWGIPPVVRWAVFEKHLVRAERLIGVILSPNLERLGLFLKRFSGIVIAGMKIKDYFCHVIKLTAGVEAGCKD